MEKKFIVNGRELYSFELSNEDLYSLINGDSLSADDKKFLTNKLIERFKYACCKRDNETNDDVFARSFSDYVNKCPNDFERAARAMANDHRYLQQEMFKLCMEFIKKLADNYNRGWYDDRNKWACQTAHTIKNYYDGL